MTNRHAVALGRLGGKARAAALTPERRREIATKANAARKPMTQERRSEIARKAANARWGRRKGIVSDD